MKAMRARYFFITCTLLHALAIALHVMGVRA